MLVDPNGLLIVTVSFPGMMFGTTMVICASMPLGSSTIFTMFSTADEALSDSKSVPRTVTITDELANAPLGA